MVILTNIVHVKNVLTCAIKGVSQNVLSRIMGAVVFIFNQPTFPMKIYLSDPGTNTQAQMFKDEVITVRFNQVKFSHVCRLPLSLSDSFLEVTGRGDQKTQTLTLNKVIDSFGSEHCCKHFGWYKVQVWGVTEYRDYGMIEGLCNRMQNKGNCAFWNKTHLLKNRIAIFNLRMIYLSVTMHNIHNITWNPIPR